MNKQMGRRGTLLGRKMLANEHEEVELEMMSGW
jgi:hypothetical protein